MAVDDESSYLPDVSQAKSVNALLQSTLSELIDLALVGKQLHWNIVGANFMPLHKLLDKFIDDWRDDYDTVAERIRQLGGSPNGQGAFIAGASGADLEVADIPTDEACEELCDRLKDESDKLRLRLEPLGEQDLISQNILIGILEEIEKQLWFIRVQCESDGNEPNNSDIQPGTDEPDDTDDTDDGDTTGQSSEELEGEVREEEEEEPRDDKGLHTGPSRRPSWLIPLKS